MLPPLFKLSPPELRLLTPEELITVEEALKHFAQSDDAYVVLPSGCKIEMLPLQRIEPDIMDEP